MKILKIQFKNIHSLAGEHCVDFQSPEFAFSNLFAITGATGSGKSTLLDIITLALYNRIPRIQSITANTLSKSGAIITHGKTEAYARVTYLCEKGIYTSEWYNRIKRTGTIDNVSQQLYDANSNGICQRSGDVPAMNTKYIGLSYEQFVKSVLLAQGDFSLFLKANKKERATLLEQLTGTEIYRLIGKQAYEKKQQVTNTIKSLENNHNLLQEKLFSQEIYDEKNSNLTKLLAEKENIDKNLNKIHSIIEEKRKINQISQKLKDITHQIEKISQQKEDFNNKEGVKLLAYEKILPFLNDLLQWEQNAQLLNEHKVSLSEKENTLLRLTSQKTKLKEQSESLIAQKITDETHLLALLSKFQEEIRDLEQKRTEKSYEFKEFLTEILHLLKEINIFAEAKTNFQELEKDLLEQKSKNEATETNLSPTLSPLFNEKKPFTLSDYNNKIIEIELKINQIIQANQLKEVISVENTQLQQLKIDKNTLETQFSNLEKEISTLKLQEKETEKDFIIKKQEKELYEIKKSLDEHRKMLTEGTPCPLCGSLHHPYKTQEDNKNSDTLSDALHLLDKKLKKIQHERISAENQATFLKQRQQEITEEIHRKKVQIGNKTKEFQDIFSNFTLSEDFISLEKNSKMQLEVLKTAYTSKKEQEIIEKVLPFVKKIQKTYQEGIKIKSELEKKTKNNNIHTEISQIQQQWISLQTEWKTNSEQVKILSEKNETHSQKHQALEESLRPKLNAIAIPSVEIALAYRMPYNEVNQLKNQLQDIENQLRTATIQKQETQKLLSEFSENRNDESEVELLKQTDTFSEKKSQIEKKIENIQYELRLFQQTTKEISNIKKQISEISESNRIWLEIHRLIGDANGERFNQFAQDLTLHQLIFLANKRLEKLFSRYIIVPSNKDEEENLMIIDQEMGNKRRSVRTLSGGESFILSLALALGLSDLASNNIRIESLFIDEGFGTLDPETLDQTLSILEKLQQENNKMIGIISHIDSLKERINTQIQIKQKGSGFSTLQITYKEN